MAHRSVPAECDLCGRTDPLNMCRDCCIVLCQECSDDDECGQTGEGE